MNLAAYALAVLSNMLVILVLPDAVTPGFLQAYSLGSMVFGVVLVYAFSTPRLGPALQRGRVAVAVLALGGAAAACATGSVPGQAVAYAVALLLSDYYLTQCGSARHVAVYRGFLIMSVVPAVAIAGPWRDWLVPLRTVGALVCLLSLHWGGRRLDQLKVGNPLFYIVATHLLYFGSLALMSWWLAGPALRAWYVGSQIGQGLVLKLMDFRIRRHASVRPVVSWSVHGLSACIGAGLAFLHWQPLALLAYAGAVLGLHGVARGSRLS
jgi:hypothetical protein